MNYKGFPIGIHTNENSVKVLEGIVQHDNGNLFQIQLYDGTEAFDFTGYSIINVVLIRPDETTLADIWPVNAEPEPVDSSSFAEDDDFPIAFPAVDPEDSDEEPQETESHTYLAIQYLDPKNGRITLNVGGAATEQIGLHRMAIEIYAGGAVLTTARVNYNVAKSLNSVDQSILQRADDYVALQSLLVQCAEIITAEQERTNQEAARELNESNRQTSVAAMIQTLTEFLLTITEKLEIASEAAETAKSWAEASQALVIEDLPQALQDAINNAAESSSTINDLVARLGVVEGKITRLDLSDDDGYLLLPVIKNNGVETYFSENPTAGAVALNEVDGALYVGTGDGEYTVVKDPDAFPGYSAVTTEPTNTDCLWIDTASGNQLRYFDGTDWVDVKSIAVFG